MRRVRLCHPVPSDGSLPRSYIYQKRWVKLDADYLRYFDSEKVGEEGGFGGVRVRRWRGGHPTEATSLPRGSIPGMGAGVGCRMRKATQTGMLSAFEALGGSPSHHRKVTHVSVCPPLCPPSRMPIPSASSPSPPSPALPALGTRNLKLSPTTVTLCFGPRVTVSDKGGSLLWGVPSPCPRGS